MISFTEALEAATHANTVGDSLALAVAMADLKAAYPAHVTTLHLGETVDGRAA